MIAPTHTAIATIPPTVIPAIAPVEIPCFSPLCAAVDVGNVLLLEMSALELGSLLLYDIDGGGPFAGFVTVA
jgi:hypothetical protein